MGKRKKSKVSVTVKGRDPTTKKVKVAGNDPLEGASDSKKEIATRQPKVAKSILKKARIQSGNSENGTDSDSDISDFSDSDEELFVQETIEGDADQEVGQKEEHEDDASDEKGDSNKRDASDLDSEGEGSDWTDASDSSSEEKLGEEDLQADNAAALLEGDESVEETDSDEDEVEKAIKKAKEPKVREYPFPIKLETEASDLSFHPYQQAVAIGDMDGRVLIYKYSNDENQLLYTLSNHAKKSIRALEFSDDGRYLISACRGRRIALVDSTTAQIRAIVKDAHDSPIYCLKSIEEHLFASGDDEGYIKLWDVRDKSCNPVTTWKEMDESVTSIIVDEDKRTLLATSGEGTVTSFNLRQRKMKLQSEVYESEFNCLGFVRDGSKLIAGSGDGMVYIFNKDEYGYQSDTFGDHPEAVNALVPITENIVATACEDGFIRAMNVFPHRFMGIIGSHERTSNKLRGYPIERLDVSTCGHFLASVSHDKQVKFWNISYFEDLNLPNGQKSVRNKKKSNRKNKQNHHLPSSNMKNLSDFFEDLGEQ